MHSVKVRTRTGTVVPIMTSHLDQATQRNLFDPKGQSEKYVHPHLNVKVMTWDHGLAPEISD